MAIKTKFEKTCEHPEFSRWCRDLLSLYDTEKQFLKNGDLYSVSYLGLARWILAHTFDGVDKLLHRLVLDSVLSADAKGSSGIYVPYFLYNTVEASPVERLSSEDYYDFTVSKTNLEEVALLFGVIFDSVGPLTKIIVKPSSGIDTVVKYRNSFQFPISLDAQFHRMVGHVEFIEQTNPIVIMIEGAPETVAEINQLLQYNHQEKRPVVLVARSFPEEVSATLATNWVKGSLSVLPLVYGDTLETMNLAADLCSVTKGELISAHFGDVISVHVTDEDKWGCCDRIEWTSKGLSIYKDVNTDRHIQTLITKMHKTEEQELKDLLQNRILSLSNDSVEVRVPETKPRVIEELQKLIEHYNGYVITGARKTPLGYLPNQFIETAVSSAQSLRKEILNIGGFLVRADDEMVA